jgi:ribulose-5-phosphate 4-epimerase/fuculose-1-phosphate aldolase
MASVETRARPGAAPEISEDERRLRVRLAATYRIVDHLGWTDTIYGHATLRVPGPERHFLINPWGLRYDEVGASNLVKIDLEGNIVGRSNYPVNRAGFVIHSAIHGAREDALCVLHTHTIAGMAVAAQDEGLLPISMYATGFHGRIAYHDYEGPSLRTDERARLVADLGEKKVMILRNHGLLTCGATLEEAFILMYRLQRACEIQLAAQAGGAPLTVPPAEVCEEAAALSDEFLSGNEGQSVGKLEYESFLRMVDRIDPSYRN